MFDVVSDSVRSTRFADVWMSSSDVKSMTVGDVDFGAELDVDVNVTPCCRGMIRLTGGEGIDVCDGLTVFDDILDDKSSTLGVCEEDISSIEPKGFLARRFEAFSILGKWCSGIFSVVRKSF